MRESLEVGGWREDGWGGTGPGRLGAVLPGGPPITAPMATGCWNWFRIWVLLFSCSAAVVWVGMMGIITLGVADTGGTIRPGEAIGEAWGTGEAGDAENKPLRSSITGAQPGTG